MPDPDALWKDIQKLDDMYEELMWHPDDELQFTHDGRRSHYSKQNTRGTRKCLMKKAEKLNGRAAMVGFHCSSGILSRNRSSNPRFMVSDMLLIAASMIGGFIFAALLTDGNVDDDDNGPDGGMMTPACTVPPLDRHN